mgnify:CR=1 FL=1
MNTYVTRQLILIDPSVPDAAQLFRGLPADSNAVMLTAHTDQITQISTLLKQYQKLEALHLVTHGSPGALHFSNAVLSSSTLNQYWDQLAGWSASMENGADILLYGCETGKGSNGNAFIKLLGHITGLNVMASSQVLGHPQMGGSWTLDKASHKQTDASLFIDNPEHVNWKHTLPTTLTPGDMVVVDFNIDNSSFRLAALTDISAGTVINITDRGWTSSNAFQVYGTNEGTITWTVGTDITAGETFEFDVTPGSPPIVTLNEVFSGSNRTGEITTEAGSWSNYSFAFSGDQILIYQGTDASPTFVYGLSTSNSDANHPSDGEWQNTVATSSALSHLPTGLTNGTSALALTKDLHFDNYAYTGPTSSADKATWLSRFGNTSNWTGHDSVQQTGVISATAADPNAKLTITAPNAVPTLTSVSTLTGATEDTEFEVTLSTLETAGDESDDNSVDGFIVKAVTTGTLKIGTDAGSATPWHASSNNLVNATNKAYWTPGSHDNGNLNAFTVVAVDNEGAESVTPVQVVVNAAAVNDAPTITNAGNYTLTAVNEETSSTPVTVAAILFDAAISLADADSGALTGIAVTSTTGTGTWEFSTDNAIWTSFGSVSASSALLLDAVTFVRFTGSTEYAGNATFSFNAWDQTSGTASTNGSAQTANASVTGTTTAFSSESATTSITVNSVDDAPSGSGAATPASFTEDTQGDLDLSGFAVSDVDSAFVTVTLTASAGTLAASSSGGVVVGGSSSALTLTGSPSDINTYLDTTTNVKYTGATNVNGTGAATITITGADGTTSNVAMGTVSINISAVDDAPTVSSVPDESVVLSVGQNIDLAASSVADVDSASVTATISVDSGTLTAASAASNHSGGAAVVQTDSQTVTLTGSPAQVDAYLNDTAELSFTSAASTANVTLTVSIDDGVNSAVSDTATISVLDVARPSASNYTDSTNEDTAVTAFSNTELPTAVDGDTGTAHTVEYITIDTSTVTGGVLSLTGTPTGGTSTIGGITFDTATGDLSGTVNIAIGDIGNLVFTPTAELSGTGAGSFDWTVTDNGGDQSTAATWTLDITPVEDAPTLTGVTSPLTALEDTATNLVTGTPVFADVDTTADVQAILTATDNAAVLTASDANGVVVSNSGTNAITLTGTAAEINTFLATPSNLTYTGSSNNTTTDTVTVSVNDGEGGTNATATTITVNFTAVNDEPVVSATGTGGNSVNGAATDLFNATAIDVAAKDTGDLITGLTFTVSGLQDITGETLNFDGSSIALVHTTTGTTTDNNLAYSVSLMGNTATVTLTNIVGVAEAAVEAAINAMTYENTAAGFTEGSRVITLAEVTDNGGTTNGGDDTWSGVSISSTATVVDGTKPTGTSYTDSTTEETPVNLSATELLTAMDIGNEAVEYITIDTSTVVGGVLSLDSTGTSGNASVGNITYHTAAGDLSGTVHINIADIGKLDFTPTANLAGTGTASFDWTATDAGGQTSPTATYTLNITNTSDDPNGTDKTIPILSSGTHTFSAADFGFTDPDTGDALNRVQVNVQDIDNGALTLNNVAVSDGTWVNLADLGQLVYTPSEVGTDTFTFTVEDDSASNATDSTPNTITLDVTAPQQLPTPQPPQQQQPEPQPEPVSTVEVDGAMVETRTEQDNTGETIRVINVAPVTEQRNDTDTTTEQADVPLHFDGEDNNTVVTVVSLPSGIGINARENTTAHARNDVADLITLINETAGDTESDREEMVETGERFLEALDETNDTLWVNQLTLTSDTSTTPDAPIKVTGTANSNQGNYQEALVIDTRQLPEGTILDLAEVEFAVIVGDNVTVRGGEGANIVFAGAGSQNIVLGADDDELHGGDGDDTVGSKGGDDKLFGDAGEDTLFGGTGKNTLHGGTGTDKATYEENADQFVIQQNHGVVTITSLNDPELHDTLINIESVQFADQTVTVDHNTQQSQLATLYKQVLGRQADVGGFLFWAGEASQGRDVGNIALEFLRSAESANKNSNTSAFDQRSDEEKVEALYQHILGRGSDADGKAWWVSQLEGGTAIETIAGDFVHSDEFGNQLLTTTQMDFIL